MDGWRGWWGEGRRIGDKVGQGGGVAEECQGREVGVMEKVSWWAERQFSAGDRCMADKVYLTPTPGSLGRGVGGVVLLQLRNRCHKRSGEQKEILIQLSWRLIVSRHQGSHWLTVKTITVYAKQPPVIALSFWVFITLLISKHRHPCPIHYPTDNPSLLLNRGKKTSRHSRLITQVTFIFYFFIKVNILFVIQLCLPENIS